ncbi:MAG: hypothetical protein JWO82_4176 [Akkermansiaceae bacterium]|nr:hypothetical protein [Akkermansiaceae bacterium]
MDLENASIRGTPLGCVAGMLAMIPLIIAGIGAYGLSVWKDLPDHKKTEGPHQLLLSCVHVGLWLGIPLVILSVWIFLKTRKSADQRY